MSTFVRYISEIIFGEVLDRRVAPSKPPEAKFINSFKSCSFIASETKAELRICGKWLVKEINSSCFDWSIHISLDSIAFINSETTALLCSSVDLVSHSKNGAPSYISGVGSHVLLSAIPHSGCPPIAGIVDVSIFLQISSFVPPKSTIALDFKDGSESK